MIPAPRYSKIDTALGSAWFVYGARGVLMIECKTTERAFIDRAVTLLGDRPVRRDPPPSFLKRVKQAVERGDGSVADLSALPPFQQRVLKAASKIPPGVTRSYADIARTIGAPNAQRAVGTALARNPVPLLIPCHRVVRSDGTLGNYGLGGTAVKRRLLAREGLR